MRAFWRAVAAALRAMRGVTTRLVRVAGKWLSVLVPAEPAAPEPIEMMPEAEAQAQRDDTLDRVRGAAAAIAGGRVPDPALLEGLSQRTVMWLAACSDEMLAKVARADDATLDGHMSGRKALRGVLRCEEDAIQDYLDACAWETVEHTPEAAARMAWAPAM